MSKAIGVLNNITDNAQKTYLVTSQAAGGTTLPVKNINGFFDNWGIQVGATGQEKSEILVISGTPSGTAINTDGTLVYPHPADTPIYAIKHDQIVYLKSAAGTSGTATRVTDGTITITPDSKNTLFTDSAGLDTDAYRALFRSSGLTTETNLSDWLTPSGYSFYSLHKMRTRTTNRLFDSKFIKNTDIIDDWINEWMDMMNNVAVDVDQDYSVATVDVSHGTDGLATITSADYQQLRRVWYTTTGVDFHRASKIPINDIDPNESYTNTNPFFFFQGDNVIGKLGDGSSGTARIVYYKQQARLDSDADELPVVMQPYTNAFVNYSLAQANYLDEKIPAGDRFMGMANVDLDRFKTQITPRSKTGPEYITFTDSIDGEVFGPVWY